MSEQFENSIRKKLQDAEAPFDPAAWDQMKKRLDDSDRRRPVIFWWILSGLLLLGSAGGFWWWSASQESQDQKQRVAVNDSVAADQPASASDEKSIPPAAGGLHSDASSGKPALYTDQHALSGKPKLSVNNHSSSGRSLFNDGENASSFVHQPEKNSVPGIKPEEEKLNVPSAVDNKQPITSSSDSTQLSTIQDSIKIKKPRRKGLEAGITLGPDYNVAGSMKRGKIGFNLGVIVKYNFSDRWSIQSGAIYNKKVYGANASEYTFTYPVTYKWIAANCNVLDVPLNVHYMFSETANTRWSAVLGASSYFMLEEKYDYWWANGNKITHQYENENQHYFSVVNIGMNWEHQTRGRLKWSLQPYMKVPLAGVGQGKITLYTAGVAAQFTLGKK